MTKFSNKLKNPVLGHSGPIFPVFGVKKNFLENLAVSCTTSYRFLPPCQNLEKFNDTIQRKCQTDRRTIERMDERTNGQNLFYRTLLVVQQPKKHSFRFLMAICFCSQIDLIKLTIVEGGQGNSLNQKCICFSDVTSLKN